MRSQVQNHSHDILRRGVGKSTDISQLECRVHNLYEQNICIDTMWWALLQRCHCATFIVNLKLTVTSVNAMTVTSIHFIPHRRVEAGTAFWKLKCTKNLNFIAGTAQTVASYIVGVDVYSPWRQTTRERDRQKQTVLQQHCEMKAETKCLRTTFVLLKIKGGSRVGQRGGVKFFYFFTWNSAFLCILCRSNFGVRECLT